MIALLLFGAAGMLPAIQEQVPPGAPASQSDAATDPLLHAEMLLARNQADAAKAILVELERSPSGDRERDDQVQFLLGLIAMAEKDYDAAIDRFRRILISRPEMVRVRLELGRALFEEGRYSEAQRQFLYARAGKLPRTVLANVDRYLTAIRQRKTFSVGIAIAVVPDSNLNAGPATDTVSLYGLPFQLSHDAQANSGVGLSIDTNVEWAPRLGKRLKWRFDALLHRVQYRQTEFDDMTLTFSSGPHLTLKRWDFNLLGNVSRRWYGDRGYATLYGPSADAAYFVTTRLGVGATASTTHIHYDNNPLQDGWGTFVGMNFFYTPTVASYVRGSLTLGRQEAQAPAYAFKSRQFGLNYVREFAGGITAGVAPSLTLIRYDAALAVFPEARRDWQYGVQLSLLNRRFAFRGLTPRLAYTFIKNDSNLELYRFRRNRLEIGVTSAF